MTVSGGAIVGILQFIGCWLGISLSTVSRPCIIWTENWVVKADNFDHVLNILWFYNSTAWEILCNMLQSSDCCQSASKLMFAISNVFIFNVLNVLDDIFNFLDTINRSDSRIVLHHIVPDIQHYYRTLRDFHNNACFSALLWYLWMTTVLWILSPELLADALWVDYRRRGLCSKEID